MPGTRCPAGLEDRGLDRREGHQDQAAVDGLAAAGVEWLGDFPEEDRRAFTDAAAEVWLTRVEEVGPPAPEYRQRILNALGR